MRIISILVLSAAVSSLAGVTSAEPETIHVPVAHADLQSPSAVAALYERVEDAAQELCRMSNRPAQTTYSGCMREVMTNAVAQADLAPLTEYAAAHEEGHATAPVELASR